MTEPTTSSSDPSGRTAEPPAPAPSSPARPGPLPTPQRVPWSQLEADFMHSWGYPTKGGKRKREPEHIEILGQNGSGKSFFVVTILKARAKLRRTPIVCVITKPDDDTLTGMGWPIIESWPPEYKDQQVLFWPKSKGISKEGREQQKAKILALLNKLWVPKANIIIYFDEVAYVCRDLQLNLEVEKYLREGRALGITVICTTQRPQGVTRYVHSESKWTICFAPKDEADAERMAEVLGSKRLYVPILMQLDRTRYEFLIVHNLTGKMYISWIDPPRRKKKRRTPSQRTDS